MLVDYLKNKDLYDNQYDTIIELYKNQKLEQLNAYYLRSKIPEAFNKNLLSERNAKFTKKIMLLLKSQSVFCAVGALHLTGETGLIKALRDNGYTVTPILNKHTPKQLMIKEKRKWYNYGNDSLLCNIQFPNDPTFESSTDDSLNLSSYTYECKDALYKLKYSISIFTINDTNFINDPKELYNSIADNLITKNKWIKIKNENSSFDEFSAEEIECNISKGVNSRLRIVANGRLLYLLGVTGYKDSIYSNVAERFFNENFLLQPSITLSLQVTDDKADVLVNHFEVHIKATVIDTVFKSDEVGKMTVNLPTFPDKYIITVSSSNYVSKKFEINTNGISKVGKSKFEILANTSLVKKSEASAKLKAFNKPYAILRLMNVNSFDWDLEYIKKVKKEIDN